MPPLMTVGDDADPVSQTAAPSWDSIAVVMAAGLRAWSGHCRATSSFTSWRGHLLVHGALAALAVSIIGASKLTNIDNDAKPR